MVLVFLLYAFPHDGRRFLEWIRSVTPLEDDVVGGTSLLGIPELFFGSILLAEFKSSVTVFSRAQNPFGP